MRPLTLCLLPVNITKEKPRCTTWRYIIWPPHFAAYAMQKSMSMHTLDTSFEDSGLCGLSEDIPQRPWYEPRATCPPSFIGLISRSPQNRRWKLSFTKSSQFDKFLFLKRWCYTTKGWLIGSVSLRPTYVPVEFCWPSYHSSCRASSTGDELSLGPNIA